MSDTSKDKTPAESFVADRLANRLIPLVLTHPLITLLVVLLLACAGGYVVTGLKFNSAFSALLPVDDAELAEVNELRRRVGGLVELVVAVGGEEEARLAFGKELVKNLRSRPWIARADVEFPVEFFSDRALHLLPLDKLKKIHVTVKEKIHRAKARANPLYVDLEDDEEDEDKAKDKAKDKDELGEMVAELQGGVGKAKAKLVKKHYVSPDGKYLFVRVKPKGSGSNLSVGGEVFTQIKALVAAGEPGKKGLEVRYAGGLVNNQEQHKRMTGDFKRAAWIALVLILLLMTLHVRNLVAPLVLVLPLVSGVVVTLGLVTLTFGQVNLVTGFLVSALIGLGIDFEIHLYLRYLERLHQVKDRKAAMTFAIRRTLPACMTAAFTTASAFFAMAIADFRGFTEYGIIAGSGVLVALVFAYVGLPPLALLISRKGRPSRAGKTQSAGSLRWAYGIVLAGLVITGFGIYHGSGVRWHSNFHKLRGKSEVVDFSDWVSNALGGTLTPGAILVDNIDQARKVERYLKERMKQPDSLVKRYISLASLIPQASTERAALLKDLGEQFEDALGGDLTEEDEARVKDGLKMARALPWTEQEIPPVFRDRFMTVDGKGQLVVIWPKITLHEDFNVIRWGKEVRSILKDLHQAGLPVKMMDEVRVSSRVIQSMWDDAPPVLLAAALAVLFFLILDFRAARPVILVYLVLGVGIVWMLLGMWWFDVEVNVFNQAVLATIIGLGIDNAVHIQHRYMQEGRGSLLRVVFTTGSASFLATATTAVGFGATVTAFHLGLRTLGQMSLIGLTATLLASTIWFPALLRVLEEHRRD